MLVSVIVPTYNRSNIIDKTIQSILDQTYKNIEIIIIDDGSADNTEDIVISYSKNSTIPIKYYWQENRGCASARNKGIQYASGYYIAFLDSDDQWTPNTIETLMASLNQSKADFIYSPAIEVYPNGSEKINYPVAKGHPEILAIEHFKYTNVRHGSVLFKKSIFDKIKGFDEELLYNEDSDFIQRVAINFKAAYSPIPTIRVHHHNKRKSSNRVAIYRALLKSAENILKEYPEFTQSIGEIAEKRLEEIKLKLLELLVQAGEFSEARRIAKYMHDKLNTSIKLSLLLNSKIPLRITNSFSSKLRFFKRLKSIK